VELTKTHDLAHDLHIEAGTLGFGIDFADIGGQCRLFFLETLDALDEGFQVLFREARLGHCRLFSREGADASPQGQRGATGGTDTSCESLKLSQTPLFARPKLPSDTAFSIPRAPCRRRFRAPDPSPARCLFPPLPHDTSRPGSCGRSRPDSSDRCSERRCARADARRGGGRRQLPTRCVSSHPCLSFLPVRTAPACTGFLRAPSLAGLRRVSASAAQRIFRPPPGLRSNPAGS